MGEKILKANSKKDKRYVEKINNIVWAIVKLTCPQTFQKTQKWVLERNIRRRKKVGARSLIRNTFGLRGHARAPGWD
jgi:hypothetical protein